MSPLSPVRKRFGAFVFCVLFLGTIPSVLAQPKEDAATVPAGCSDHSAQANPPVAKSLQDSSLASLCAEWFYYQAEAQDLSQRKKDFQAKAKQLGDLAGKAKEIADNYQSELDSRAQSVGAMQETLLEMIQLTQLQPLLDGKSLQESGVRLAQLQTSLVKQGADMEAQQRATSKDLASPQTPAKPATQPGDTAPKANSSVPPPNLVAYSPPGDIERIGTIAAPEPVSESGLKLLRSALRSAKPTEDPLKGQQATPPTPPTTPGGANGTGGAATGQSQGAQTAKPSDVTGRILAFDSGEGLSSAVVVLQCGTNGATKYVSSTNKWGQYYFSGIPGDMKSCVLRGARNLTDEQERSVEKKLTDKVPLTPQDWSYEEVSLNPINLGDDVVVAPDLRLPRRKSRSGEFARVVTGFEQSGASSSNSAQKYFFDLYLSVPVTFSKSRAWQKSDFGPRFRAWGDARITSVPQQVTSSLGEFAIGFSEQIANVKVNEIAQAAQFEMGGEERIASWGWARSPFFSFDHSSTQRFGLYAIASFGRTTTLNPLNSVQVYNNPVPGSDPNFDQEIAALGLTSQLAGKKYVAFESEDRLKFYKDYYAGIRMKTYYFDPDTAEPLGRFPATLDAVLGQNETITGGKLSGAVARIDGFYPFPYNTLKYIYLFGTADILVGGRRSQNTIILQQATNPPALPDPSALLIATPQLSRDHYRLGVGIDVLQLFSTIKSSSDNKPQQPAKNNGTGGGGTTPSPSQSAQP